MTRTSYNQTKIQSKPKRNILIPDETTTTRNKHVRQFLGSVHETHRPKEQAHIWAKWTEREREKETRVKVQDLLKKQALIGDDGAAAGAGAFACDDSVASRSAASPASSLPLLCGSSLLYVVGQI